MGWMSLGFLCLQQMPTPTPVGKNTLDTRLGKMCLLAGTEGRVTNHSMCVTSVTQMYATGVPEKVIQERTGHRSLEALHIYERTNNQQHQMVSRILSDLSENAHVQQTKHSKTQKHSAYSVTSVKPSSNQQSIHISLKNLHTVLHSQLRIHLCHLST